MPTVSGVFRLDSHQAQSSLRALRHEAEKTDVSIATLGKTLDGVGSKRQAKQLEDYTRAQRGLGNQSSATVREADKLTSAVGRHEKQMTRATKAWRGFLAQLKELKLLLVPAKFMAIGAALGYAVQGITSLGGGLISLLPRITDLAKGAAPAVAGLLGLASGAAATMLSFSSLSKAMSGNKAALKSLTPEARTFLATLKAYKPVVESLRKASQQGLFPGLTAATARLAGAAPTGRRILRRSGAAVGGAALTVARGLTEQGTLGDIESLAGQGSRMIRSLGRDFVHLARIILNFGMAAKPFTDWVIRTTEAWMKHREAISLFNRDSGKTAAQLERTKSALKGFVGLIGDLWNGLRSIGQASRATGDSLWGSMERGAHAWREVMGSPQEQVRLREMFSRMRVDVEAIGRLFLALAHGLLGVRTQGNTFAAMTDKLTAAVPSIVKVLNNITATFGPTLVQALKTFGDVLAGASGMVGPWDVLLRTINGILRGVDWLTKHIPPLGNLLKTIFGVALIGRFLVKLGLLEAGWWRVGRAAGAAAAAEAAALGGGAGRPGSGFGGGVFGRTAGKTGEAAKTAGRFGRLGGAAGVGLLAGGLAASFIPGRTGSIASAALSGAGTGAMLGTMFGPEGTAIGAGAGALVGGAMGFLSSRRDPGAQHVAGINKTLAAGLTAVESYPIALGRLQAELNLYQHAAKQLADDHSAAAQQEIDQMQQSIDARKGEIAAIREEARQKERAKQMGITRAVGSDLDRLVKMLIHEGMTPSQARGEAAREGLEFAKGRKPGVARTAQVKGMIKEWAAEMKRDPSLKPLLTGLTSKAYDLIGGGPITRRGRKYQGTQQEIGMLESAFAANPITEAHRQKRQKGATRLQQALYFEIRAWGFSPAVAMAEAMSNDGKGVLPGNLMAFLRKAPAAAAFKKGAGAFSAGASGFLPSFGSMIQGINPVPSGPHGWVVGKQVIPGNRVSVSWSDGFIQQMTKKQAAKYAGGGRVPGSSLQDVYQIAPGQFAGGGELVVNRHTEAKVNGMLGGGRTLGGMVAGETRPHSAQMGDSRQDNHRHGEPAPQTQAQRNKRGLMPGIAAIAALMMKRFPGLSISSAVRAGDTGSYHSTGQAVDLAAPMNTAGIALMQKAGGWARANLAGALLEGIHNSSLSVKNGSVVPASFWGSSTWADHLDHVHLAAGQAGVAGAGAAGSAGAGVLPGSGVGATGTLGAVPLGAYGARQRAIASVTGVSGFRGLTPASKPSAPGGTAGPVSPSGGGGTNREIGKRMMLAMGWGAGQWPSLEQLWTGESGWREDAFNSSSGATGIPQALPGNKMASAGADWQTNPATQIKWGLGYIKGRYGTPSNAYSTWQNRSPHWYAHGGRTPKWGGWHAKGGSFTADGPTLVGVGEKGKERVTVTPAGKGRGGGFQPHVEVNVYGGDPREVEQAVERALMKVAAHLETTSVNLDGEDF